MGEPEEVKSQAEESVFGATLRSSTFNGKPYAGSVTRIPLMMFLYLQALSFVQGMTLRGLYEDCSVRFLDGQPWAQGLPPAGLPPARLRWREVPPEPISGLNGWVQVDVRLPQEQAEALYAVSLKEGVCMTAALYTMLYWYSWVLYPPLHEQERRKMREARVLCHRSLP